MNGGRAACSVGRRVQLRHSAPARATHLVARPEDSQAHRPHQAQRRPAGSVRAARVAVGSPQSPAAHAAAAAGAAAAGCCGAILGVRLNGSTGRTWEQPGHTRHLSLYSRNSTASGPREPPLLQNVVPASCSVQPAAAAAATAQAAWVAAGERTAAAKRVRHACRAGKRRALACLAACSRACLPRWLTCNPQLPPPQRAHRCPAAARRCWMPPPLPRSAAPRPPAAAGRTGRAEG